MSHNNIYACPMAFLNACILDLAKRKFEIKKILIFEDPPQAILHIEHNTAPPPQKSWLRKFRGIKDTQAALTYVKLFVTSAPDSQVPFHLNYEIMPSEAL